MALVHKNRYQVKIQGKGIQDTGTGLEERDIYLDQQYVILSDLEVEKVITRDFGKKLAGGVLKTKVTQKVAKFKLEKPFELVDDTVGWDGRTILLLSWAGLRGNIIDTDCVLYWSDAFGVNGGIGQMQVSNPEGETLYIDGIMAKVSIIGEMGKLIKMEMEGLGKVKSSLTWSSYASNNTGGKLVVPGSVKVEGSVVEGVKSWRLDIGGDVQICEGVEQDDGVYLIYRPEIEITFEMDPVDSSTIRDWRERESPVSIQVMRKAIEDETEEQVLITVQDMYVQDFGDEVDNNILRRKVKFICGDPTTKLYIYPTYNRGEFG